MAGCGVIAFLPPAAVLSLGEGCLFSHSTQNVEIAAMHVVEVTEKEVSFLPCKLEFT